MAKRKRKRFSGFGSSAEIHRDRSKHTLREIHRLQRVIRTKMKSPPDCVHAASLVRALAQQEGAFLIDRDSGGRRARSSSSSRALFDRFVKACVISPRNSGAMRKIHAVWR
jgi:hypothetical protein